jgi:predicted lipoprotein with Yx(FWY)xxD motif
MRAILIVLASASILLAGCGGDGDDERSEGQGSAASDPAAKAEEQNSEKDRGAGQEKAGTEIVVGDSEFGEMLYDSNDQAIYIFENDGENETVCYDECAEAWPPVVTDGEPKAGSGVDGSLLGTIERDDGTTQVTYAGQPLYYYAHEAPGEVRCHNVDLNGGLWWVVGPDGVRLP